MIWFHLVQIKHFLKQKEYGSMILLVFIGVGMMQTVGLVLKFPMLGSMDN